MPPKVSTPHPMSREILDKHLYGRPLAYNHNGEGPYGLPYLNNGPMPLHEQHVPEWHAFVTTEDCFFKRLCMYCGNRMTGPMVHVRYRGEIYRTSGPPSHPTCALYATRACPHVTRDEEAGKGLDVIAYVTMGDIGAVPVINERGWIDVITTFGDGMDDVHRHAIPITGQQLKELAREWPER